MKKPLVVGVIVLFLGLACAPSVNANVQKESELVEITTEICGLDGGKHTVQLTKEEAEEVEQLIDDIERRLDEVETREETVEIFNEVVVELDKYGLLGGLSIKQAQRLVTGGYQNSRIRKLKEIFYDRRYTTLDDGENRNCLIVGNTNNTYFEGLISRIFSWEIGVIDVRYTFFGNLLGIINPIALGHRIGLGIYQPLWDIQVNASGWI